MKQQLSTASNYSEACDLLRSGYVKHVRLNWNIGSDEFFRIASDWCDTGAKIKKDEDGLPHFNTIKKLAVTGLEDQERYLKIKIIEYLSL